MQEDETSLRWEDLSIDDSLEPLPRLLQYAQSPIALQRLVHVKQLSDVCIKTDLQTLVNLVLPVIRKLEEDEEYVVRQHLVEQVVKVGVGVMVKEVRRTGLERNGTERNGTERNGTERRGMRRSRSGTAGRELRAGVRPFKNATALSITPATSCHI